MQAYKGKQSTIATAVTKASPAESRRAYQAEYQRQWYEDNKEAVKAYKHQWYLANKERLAIKTSQYQKEHREQARGYNAKYRKNNMDKVMAGQTRRRNARTAQGLNVQTGKPLQVVTGNIYLAESAGRIKIGRSNDATYRSYDLNTHSPFPVKILWESDEIVGVNFVEKALHNKYKAKQVHGEWFVLKPTNVKHIKTAVNKISVADHTITV